MADKNTEGTATLDKALDVLDAIGASGQGLSRAELGERLAVPRTTLYRLLGTLVDRGLVRRDPLRRVYCLGFRCFEYARQAYAMPDLVAAAASELRALRDLSGETTYLAVLDGLDALSLERVDGAHSLRSAAALGQRKPLYCTSQGKAMLSALAPERRDAIVKDLTLAALTPHTITDRRRLQAELRTTAARGYAIDDEEIALGVRCCGAPIVDPSGEVRGAVSIAAPAFRMTLQRLQLLGPEVAQAARRIGAQLDAVQVRPVEGPISVVAGSWAFHGAFPQWSQSLGCLHWADTLAPTLHRFDGHVDGVIATFDTPVLDLLHHAGGLLVMQQDGWHDVSTSGAVTPSKALPRRRLQSVAAAPDGSAWACLADGDGWRVSRLLAEGPASGGWRLSEPATALAWDSQGASLYAAAPDSGTLFVLKPGSAAVRRLVTVPKGSGRVAGLAVDHEGGVWTALRDGWSVVRFSPDGTLERVVSLPVSAPSGLAFGGVDGRTLYVVSARDALSADTLANAPLSGRLFAFEVDVQGVPAHPLVVAG